MKRYPVGPVTPHGAWHLRRGRIPNLQLTAYDESIRFDLMGGKAIPHRTAPEVVVVKRGGLKGLIPPWKPSTRRAPPRTAQPSSTPYMTPPRLS